MSSQQYFCHHCNRSVGLRDSDLICGICGSDFIELLPHNPQPTIFGPSIVHRPRYGLVVPRYQIVTNYLAVPMNPPQQAGPNFRAISRTMRRPDTPLPIVPPNMQGMNQSGVPNRRTFLPQFLNMGHDIQARFRATNPAPPQSNQQQPERVAQAGNVRNADGENFRDIFASLPEIVNQLARNNNGENPQFRLEFRVEGGGGGEVLHIGDYAFGDMDAILSNLMNLNGEAPSRSIPEAQLQYLPMTKVSQTHVDNKTQCSTCFEEFLLDEPVAELKCTHIFHADCLKPWLRTHNTCPVCRGEVNPAEWSIPPTAEGAGTNQEAINQENVIPVPSSAPQGMVDQDELD